MSCHHTRKTLRGPCPICGARFDDDGQQYPSPCPTRARLRVSSPEHDIRICPTCGGGRIVQHEWRDDYGDMNALDTCPDCDGTGEIEVAPIEEEDLSE